MLLNALLCGLVSALDFPSFTLQGNDLRRIESLLALLYLSACGLNSRAGCNFLYVLRLLEMPCFKVFRDLASIK